MRKLLLSLDRLEVESFETLPEGGVQRGTVQAHSFVCPLTDGFDTCDCPTGWRSSCPPTCPATCDGDSCNTCLTYCGQLSCVEICP